MEYIIRNNNGWFISSGNAMDYTWNLSGGLVFLEIDCWPTKRRNDKSKFRMLQNTCFWAIKLTWYNSGPYLRYSKVFLVYLELLLFWFWKKWWVRILERFGNLPEWSWRLFWLIASWLHAKFHVLAYIYLLYCLRDSSYLVSWKVNFGFWTVYEKH